MIDVPKPCPQEFRDDVVAVAGKRGAPLSQIARDFGISEGYLPNRREGAGGSVHVPPIEVISLPNGRNSHPARCEKPVERR